MSHATVGKRQLVVVGRALAGAVTGLALAGAVTGLALAGCAKDSGKALDLTLSGPECDGVRLELTVALTPAAQPRDPVPTVSGASGRVVLLLPEATTQAEVTLQALDSDGAPFGTPATKSYAFSGPAEQHDTLVVDGACPAPDQGVTEDLAQPDLIPPAVEVTARGAVGDTPFEGEGSQAPSPENGVAVLIHSSTTRLGPATMLTSSYLAAGDLGALHVSADGRWLATSVRLKVDPALGAGATIPVDLTLETPPGDDLGLDDLGVTSDTVAFDIAGLAELTSSTTLNITSDAPRRYSSVGPGVTLTLTGGGGLPAYLWVSGPFEAASVNANGIGFQGCAGTNCNAQANGPGFGGNGTSGGGAGYVMAGAAGNGGNGGAAYGDPSLIAIVGGSGGGSGEIGAGGAGGGAVRIVAGKIKLSGAIAANGADGISTTLLSGASAAGSGGAILLQSQTSVTGGSVSVQPGETGTSALLGSNAGEASAGRVRVDVGQPGAPTTSASPGYYGAAIAADWATAWGAPPTKVDVVCGLSTKFHVEIDGNSASAQTTCTSGAAPAKMSVNLTAPPSAQAIHKVCVVSAAASGTPQPRYAGDDAENQSCRSIAVAGP